MNEELMQELMQKLIQEFLYLPACPKWAELSETERAETLQRVLDVIEHQKHRHKFMVRKIGNLRRALTDYGKGKAAWIREKMAERQR